MTDTVFDQAMAIRATGKVNMFSLQEVFELALQMNFDELANFIFSSTEAYCNFILTGERK